MSNSDIYKKLIKRRNYWFMFVLIIPIFILLFSAYFGEENIFIFIAIYIAISVIWTLIIYFSSFCPKCNGLFFGPMKNTIVIHKFFMNNKCNNCGYRPEKT